MKVKVKVGYRKLNQCLKDEIIKKEKQVETVETSNK